MRNAILNDHPGAAVAVTIVWIPMLVSDNEDAAFAPARLFDDPRACQFYDARRQVGRTVAHTLGGEGAVAWDTYLFYPPTAEWADRPPPPIDWLHQLSGSAWADPKRFRTGKELRQHLSQMTDRYLISPS